MKRIDLYTFPHNEQRIMLFELAHQAATINFNERIAVEALIQKLQALIKNLHEHVENEETWLHPFILSKFGKEVLQFEEDHKLQEDLLDELEKNIQALQADLQNPQELGQKVYKSLCKFISCYLKHIEQEEEIMPLLWKAFVDAELWAVLVVFQMSRNPAEAEILLKDLTTTLSTEDLGILFAKIKDVYSLEEYESVMRLHERGRYASAASQ